MIKDRIVSGSFVFSGLMLMISRIVALLSLPTNAGDIIIRFDNYHNEVVWAGSFALFFGVILTAAAVVLINFLLVRHIYPKERFLAYLLSVGTGAVSLLFAVGTFAITLIN